jgi:hypothetical protein
VRGVRIVADVDKWHGEYQPDGDEIILRAKFAKLPFDEQVRVILHEAGHRGQFSVDEATFDAFVESGLGTVKAFQRMANAVHLADYREQGFVVGLEGETFAESYARFCLDGALPPGFREFWNARKEVA